MSQFPTNKTVPLDKDVGVSQALSASLGTGTREQLSVVLSTIDSTIAANKSAGNAAIAAEQTRATNAEAALQTQITNEVSNRTTAVSNEATARANADTAETTRATTAETSLQTQLDGERSPLRILASGTTKAISIASAKTTRTDSAGVTSNLLVMNGSLASDFGGATIDFNAGTVVYTNGNQSNGSFSLISFAGQASKFAKYAIVLLPGAPNSILILNGSSFGTTAALAAEPAASGGILIGFVAVQDNGTGGTGTIQNVVQASIEQGFASGSGSGGSGSGSPLDPQADETFVYYTRSDFKVDSNTFVGSTTGTDQTLGLGKIILSVAQQFVSKDLIGQMPADDAAFLNQAQVRLLYNNGKMDLTPTIEVSRDGGNSWATAANTVLASSGNSVIGDIFFSPTTVISNATNGARQTAASRWAALYTTNRRVYITQFSAVVSSSATSGSIVGKIYTTSSGTPQTVLATCVETYTPGSDITTTPTLKTFTLTKPIVLAAGTAYAFSVEGTGATVLVDSTTATTGTNLNAAGSSSFASGWSASATNLAFSIAGHPYEVKIRVTSGTALSELIGFGFDFVADLPVQVTGQAAYEERTIVSTEATTGIINLNSAKFTVGARQLQVNHNGHVFMAPDFVELSPTQVQFPANFFQPGDFVKFYTAFGVLDGSSISLSKTNTLNEIVVGSPSQLAAGIATHSSINSAIQSSASGAVILILQGTYNENVVVDRQLYLVGKGFSSIINGTVSFNTGSSYSSMKLCQVQNNIIIATAASGVIVTENWINSGFTCSGGTNALILNIGM